MNALMVEYRDLIRPLLNGDVKVTPAFGQAAINQTLAVFGIDPKAKPPRRSSQDEKKRHALRIAVGMRAASLLVREQGPMCLPKLDKPGLDEHQLKLLNEDYELDGSRFRLGSLTPKQVRETIFRKMLDQQSALNHQVRLIRNLLRRCTNDNQPIIEQIT